eukprot:TRINITY_DN2450_c0_g2_i1.p1 TRINITY_DN2450_c0_g2~~TRINITY_DN2450_c0_g2_i1.p1  ORF type:complete len:656 (-),score=75.22 TRINITY_DN2450_c0_g2_i1:11-1978(-)
MICKEAMRAAGKFARLSARQPKVFLKPEIRVSSLLWKRRRHHCFSQFTFEARHFATCGTPSSSSSRLERVVAPCAFSALNLASFSREELCSAFNKIDDDRSGFLDIHELNALIRSLELNLSEREVAGSVDLLMRRFDGDGDGLVSFEEFCIGVKQLVEQHQVSSVLAVGQECSSQTQLLSPLRLTTFSDAELKEAFRSADTDGDGRLDHANMCSLFKAHEKNIDSEQASLLASALVRRLDGDGDGLICFDEFKEGIPKLAKELDTRVWSIAFTMFASGLAVGAVTPALPLLSVELGMTQAQFGYTVTALGLSTLLANIPCAVFVDKYGRRPVIGAGLLLQGVSVAALGFAHGLPHFIGARLITGMGVSSLIGGSTMIVTDISTALNRARMMAITNSSFSAGKILGPAVGGATIAWIGISPTFFCAGGVFAGAAVYSHLCLAETKTLLKQDSAPLSKTVGHMLAQWKLLLQDKDLRSLVILNASSLATHAGCFYTLMPLMLTGDFCFTPVQIGGIFASQAAMAVICNAPSTVLIERLGPEKVLGPALALTAAAMAAFPQAQDLYQVSAAILLWSFGRTILNSAPVVIAASSVAPESRSQAIAMLRSTGDLGFMLGATMLGAAGSVVGAAPAMQGTALLSCATAAWYVLRGRRPHSI